MQRFGAALVLTFLLAGAARAQEEAPPSLEELERRLDAQQAELDRQRELLKRLRGDGGPGTEASPPAGETRPPGTGGSTPPEPPPSSSVPDADDPAGAAEGEAPERAGDEGAKLEVAFGEGAKFTSADETFSLQLRGRIQLRYTHLYDEDEDSSDRFEVRRARLVLRGHALVEELTYNIQLAFSNQDTESDLRLVLRDAYVNYAFHRDLELRAGQMKVPFNPQRVTSSSALQFPDRSIVQNELNLDRDVGVQLHSSDLFGLGHVLGYAIGLFGGDGRNRLADDSGLLYVLRLQVNPFGKIDIREEADIARTKTPKLAIGGALARNERTVRLRSTFGDTVTSRRPFDYVHAEADLNFKWLGFSFRAEGLLRHADEKRVAAIVGGAARADATRSAWGFFGQAGYMLTDHLEVSGRYGELRPLRRLSAVAFERETGGGLSWYFFGHDLKVQTDYFYLWGKELSEGDHQVRLQFQLYF
jgi:phosphate-selective porin OprO and OprP